MTHPEQQQVRPYNPMRETNHHLATIKNILIFWNVLVILVIVWSGLSLLVAAF